MLTSSYNLCKLIFLKQTDKVEAEAKGWISSHSSQADYVNDYFEYPTLDQIKGKSNYHLLKIL